MRQSILYGKLINALYRQLRKAQERKAELPFGKSPERTAINNEISKIRSELHKTREMRERARVGERYWEEKEFVDG